MFRVKDCGMNFEWGLFNFTDEDCRKLAAAIKATKHLRVLRIHHSKVEDKKARLLVSHLLDHPGLQTLGKKNIKHYCHTWYYLHVHFSSQ